jgi:hypothetical protein
MKDFKIMNGFDIVVSNHGLKSINALFGRSKKLIYIIL